MGRSMRVERVARVAVLAATCCWLGVGVVADGKASTDAVDLGGSNDPDLIPLKDCKSFHAQLHNRYKKRIEDYETRMETARPLEKIKMRMIIADLELDRAEACKNVLQQHGVEVEWKVDPKKDNAIGAVKGGVDSNVVSKPIELPSARRILATSKPRIHQPHAHTSQSSHTKSAQHTTKGTEQQLHMVPLTSKQLGEEAGLSAAQMQTLTQEAAEEVAAIKKKSAAAAGAVS